MGHLLKACKGPGAAARLQSPPRRDMNLQLGWVRQSRLTTLQAQEVRQRVRKAPVAFGVEMDPVDERIA